MYYKFVLFVLVFVFTARNHKFGRQNQGGPSESDDEAEYNSYGMTKTHFLWFLVKKLKFLHICINVHKY